MTGININCKKYDFVGQILEGQKTIETRKKPSLRPYVGKRVGLIQTGRGRAVLLGYATVRDEKRYTSYGEFRDDYDRHRVEQHSIYDRAMYGYTLADVEPCEPRQIFTQGIVARQI